jgi:hypothetical protein
MNKAKSYAKSKAMFCQPNIRIKNTTFDSARSLQKFSNESFAFGIKIGVIKLFLISIFYEILPEKIQ